MVGSHLLEIQYSYIILRKYFLKNGTKSPRVRKGLLITRTCILGAWQISIKFGCSANGTWYSADISSKKSGNPEITRTCFGTCGGGLMKKIISERQGKSRFRSHVLLSDMIINNEAQNAREGRRGRIGRREEYLRLLYIAPPHL